MTSPARPSSTNSKLPKFFIFAGVGVINTLADLGVFTALVQCAHWPATAANICSYSAAICLSFVLNRNITFRQRTYRHKVLHQFVRFAGVNLIALALSTAQVGLFANFLHPVLAKLLSIPATFAWGFVASRRHVFRPPEEQPASSN